MSNNWKNSTISQADKLELVKKGDKDIYNSEKELNGNLRKARAEAGLDTTQVDAWDSALDGAMYSYNKSNTPKYYSASKGEAMLELYNSLLETDRQYKESIKNLKEESGVVTDYVTELLVNNGYSTDGSMGKEKLGELGEYYRKSIDALEKGYDSFKKSARKAFGYNITA